MLHFKGTFFPSSLPFPSVLQGFFSFPKQRPGHHQAHHHQGYHQNYHQGYHHPQGYQQSYYQLPEQTDFEQPLMVGAPHEAAMST